LEFGGIKPRSQESRRGLTRLHVLIKVRDLIAPLTRMTLPGDERLHKEHKGPEKLKLSDPLPAILMPGLTGGIPDVRDGIGGKVFRSLVPGLLRRPRD